MKQIKSKNEIKDNVSSVRLINSPDYLKNIICNYCRQIPLDPVICKYCTKSYCRACSNSILITENQTCLCNNQLIVETNIPVSILMNYKMLTFKCLNIEDGCKEIIKYEDLRDHDINCPFSPVVCPNKGCKKQIILQNFHQHSKKCEWKKMKCNFCGMECIFKNLNMHKNLLHKEKVRDCTIEFSCEECSSKIINCQGFKCIICGMLSCYECLKICNQKVLNIPEEISNSMKNRIIWSFDMLERRNRDLIISTDEVTYISSSISLMNYPQILHLFGLGLEDNHIKILTKGLLHNQSLKRLNLGWNLIKDKGLKYLSKLLMISQNLENLELQNNLFESEGLLAFGDSFKMNCNLISLNISLNKVSLTGAKFFAVGIKENASLNILDMAKNYLHDNGIFEICNVLKFNRGLLHINLSENNFSDTACKEICYSLCYNATLRSIHMESNLITDKSLKFISHLLLKNSILTSINLKKNLIGRDNIDELIQVVLGRKITVVIEFDGNLINSQYFEHKKIIASKKDIAE